MSNLGLVLIVAFWALLIVLAFNYHWFMPKK